MSSNRRTNKQKRVFGINYYFFRNDFFSNRGEIKTYYESVQVFFSQPYTTILELTKLRGLLSPTVHAVFITDCITSVERFILGNEIDSWPGNNFFVGLVGLCNPVCSFKVMP